MATADLFSDSVLANAHVGIAIVDASNNHSIYSYQSQKYFIPASNTKIVSLYAGMKFLGDSLTGLKYTDTKDTLYIIPTGDPTFLHPDFATQKVYDFLRKQSKPIAINITNWNTEALGEGWMWDDYNGEYMTERSAFPVYENVIRWIQIRDSASISAMAREEAFIYSEPDINWKTSFSTDTGAVTFSAKRAFTSNNFFITQGKEPNQTIAVPFITNGINTALELLKDTLPNSITVSSTIVKPGAVIHSQPVDSVLKLMMYHSDNFLAEQTLLMSAEKKLGMMDDKRMIDYLLKNDLSVFPQKPRWADGSGLSRYNAFTPQDFVWVLNKMKEEFGMERLKNIFPSGGQGTLTNYYQSERDFIFAKTGSMSGVTTLSGYLYAKSGKLLLFSVLVNSQHQPAWMVKKKVESFLQQVRNLN
ncbi:MAG: D-alanyl-D-alanine carboxypeptidase [Agriterribacter sp.]